MVKKKKKKKNLPAMQETWVRSLSWKDSLKREWLSTPASLPGKFHGQRSLVDYSPWIHKESATAEWLSRLRHTRSPKEAMNVLSPNYWHLKRSMLASNSVISYMGKSLVNRILNHSIKAIILNNYPPPPIIDPKKADNRKKMVSNLLAKSKALVSFMLRW